MAKIVWEKVWDTPSYRIHSIEKGFFHMKKLLVGVAMLPCLLLSLSGCGTLNDRLAGIPAIYAIATALSLLMLIGYCYMIHRKNPWFLLLFISVSIVNCGYLVLSLSTSLEGALWANRISYLGSVFLPLSMMMIILDACRLRYRKWLPRLLIAVGAVVFLIAASPGWLEIYYKEVSLQIIDGVAMLVKKYGPWHKLYLFYLLSYFICMIAVITHASIKKRILSNKHAIMLLVAVLVNIGVWLLEQLVKVDFEFLSVSYIISELFLLGLCLMMQELDLLHPSAEQPREATAQPPLPAENAVSAPPEPTPTAEDLSQRKHFASQLKHLTPTERLIYDLYLQKKSTKEIMTELNIKENTLKYHNKNIYGKLGVRSRKQLCEIARTLEENE